MAARKTTPEYREQRKKLLALLQDAGINDVSGLEDLFKEMVGTVMENGLDGELENELGLFCVYGLKGFRYVCQSESEPSAHLFLSHSTLA